MFQLSYKCCLMFTFIGCVACKEGWETDDEKGCIDLNECLLEAEPCKQNEFCVNTEGSYTCIGNLLQSS